MATYIINCRDGSKIECGADMLFENETELMFGNRITGIKLKIEKIKVSSVIRVEVDQVWTSL